MYSLLYKELHIYAFIRGADIVGLTERGLALAFPREEAFDCFVQTVTSDFTGATMSVPFNVVRDDKMLVTVVIVSVK